MGFRYGPWQTRTVDVYGLDPSPVFGSFTVSGDLERTDAAADYGATSPGTYPWRSAGNRVLTADRARNKTSPDHSPTHESNTFVDLSAYPDTGSRIATRTARVGVQSFTTADRVLIGTYYDDFTFGMWLGRAAWIVSDYWLANLYDQPQTYYTGAPKTLTTAEWASLWDTGPPSPEYSFRQVDVPSCGVEIVPQVDFESTSTPTAPAAIRRRLVTSATSGALHYPSDTIDAEPAVGSITGATSLSLTGGTGPLTDLTHGPHFHDGGTGTDTPLDPTGYVYEFDLPSVLVPWGIEGGDTSAVYAEWLDYDPQWPTGVDPGYDETGGVPPADPPSRIFQGGTGADRWANVRLQVTWRFTARWRWAGFSAVAPPLWQRQRIGVMDSPEQFTSGLLTPQSSPWQGGIL